MAAASGVFLFSFTLKKFFIKLKCLKRLFKFKNEIITLVQFFYQIFVT